MTTRRKLLVGFLVLVEIGLLAAMVAVLRPGVGRWDWNAFNPPGIFWGGGRVQAAERFEREFEVGAQPDVLILNDVGRVRVVGGETGRVRVTGERVGFGLSRAAAEERLRAVNVDVREEAGRLVIEGRIGRGQYRGDRVDLTVEVPPGVVVEVRADMGGIVLRDVGGNAAVTASMGAVDVKRFQGNLEVDASMGRVTVREAMITDLLRLEAGMGRIDFEGVPGTFGAVDAGMGSVELRLPPETALTLDVSVGLGRFDSDFPLTGESTDRAFQGVLGTGEPQGRLVIDAGMGGVRIRERR